MAVSVPPFFAVAGAVTTGGNLACSLLTAALWPAPDVPPLLAVFELLLDPQAAAANEAAASSTARNTRRTSYLLCGLLDPRRAQLVSGPGTPRRVSGGSLTAP